MGSRLGGNSFVLILRVTKSTNEFINAARKNGTVCGTVWGFLFGLWTPSCGIYWKTSVTMESKVLAHRHTGRREDEKKHKARHQVRQPTPPPCGAEVGFQ